MFNYSLILLFLVSLSRGQDTIYSDEVKRYRGRKLGCTIPLTNVTEVPLILTAKNFLYPKYQEKEVNVDEGVTVQFACPGNNITNLEKGQNDLIAATCSKGSFRYKNKIIRPETLKCAVEPLHSARYTKKTCELKGKEIEIGYAVSKNSFIRLILICFDEENQIALYSHYNLTRSISSHIPFVARPYFIEDKFYNLTSSVNNLYYRRNQRRTINKLLGLPEESTQYIKDDAEFFLARGHFTAKADFIYASQQRATFYYINVAPQWQVFNEGNWVSAEIAARNVANMRNVDLKVYTGSYGVAVLPHSKTRRSIKLYLYNVGKTKAIPVPKLYWKVLYEPIKKAGIALVGVNNPYLKAIGNNRVCKDVSSTVSWLAWQAKNFTAGYSYACTVDDLRKTVKQIPVLDVRNLLV